MYGIFTYIWAIFGVNVGKYSLHGASGILDILTIVNFYDDLFTLYATIYVTCFQAGPEL